MRFFSGYDFGVIIPASLLLLLSLIILSSIDIELFQSQALFALLGLFAFLFISSIDTRLLKRMDGVLYLLSLTLLVLVLVFGVEVRGAKRWIELGEFRMQFSELIKPLLVVALAAILARWYERINLKRIVLLVSLFLPIAILISRQPDLGNTLIYSVAFIFMLLSAGLNFTYILGGLFLFVVAFPLLWQFLADYQQDRLISFISPAHDPLGIGYNAIQSAIAVGSGLLFGRGLGRGVQSQLQFLPERHTDFIFASFAEELGFLGSFAVLVLYFFLLLRILRILRTCEGKFESYVLVGIFIVLLSQVFINIGMNIGIVPITGVTLPLFSYGGSSLISTMVFLGIANSISRSKKKDAAVLEIR